MNWKFKPVLEPVGQIGFFWYDLAKGDYIKPEKILIDKDQIEKLKAAVATVLSFELALQAEDLLTGVKDHRLIE